MFPVSTDPLSDEEIDWLEAFLLNCIDEDTDTRDLDEGVSCLSELDGLLTAVISGPVMLPPSQWLPQKRLARITRRRLFLSLLSI